MKRQTLIALLLLPVMSLFAQVNLTLSFNAVDNPTGLPLTIDSINIANLTSGTDTTIFGTTITLVLLYTGIIDGDNTQKGLYLSDPIPNPGSGTCKMTISTEQTTSLNVTMHTMNGTNLYTNEFDIGPGYYTLDVSTAGREAVILTAQTQQVSVSKKIISLNNGSKGTDIADVSLNWEGTFGNKTTKGKSGGFSYNLYDTLLFTGYVSSYDSGQIMSSPTTNTNYTFSLQSNSTHICGDSLLDMRDGQSYATVQIGTQCWMAENLNVGTMVNSVHTVSLHSDVSNNGIIEKYCYNNTSSNCDQYGGLYEWNEAMDYSTTAGIQGICPSGWHLPTNAEWCTLATYLDPTVNCNFPGNSGTDAGGKMKETGTTHWHYPNYGATNSNGFTALGAGYRRSYGNFENLRYYASFWSSSDSNSDAICWWLACNRADIRRGPNAYTGGFSVRCLRN